MYELKRLLVEELKTLFSDTEYPAVEGEVHELHVYPDLPPIRTDADDTDDYDFLTVRTSSGGRDDYSDPERIVMRIGVGVCDDDDPEHSGASTLELIIRRILDHFDTYPLVGKKYRCDWPRSYAMADEDLSPYYYGGIELTFIRPTFIEEDANV